LARLTWTTPAFGEYLNAERAFFGDRTDGSTARPVDCQQM